MVKYTRSKKKSSRELRSSSHKKLRNQCSFKRVVSKKVIFAAAEKCAWTDATCPVCMEIPHNAVLLLCSSHYNGCRPYICATNFQLSNCLDQLVESSKNISSKDPDSIEFACPLCRGAVKGYTLVEPARKQLNQKSRSCMHDGCSYLGTYRQLCKHVRKKHHSGNPRAVDPQHAIMWNRLLFRTSLQDIMCSTSSPVLRRVLSALLQYEEYLASGWRQNDDPHGATEYMLSFSRQDGDPHGATEYMSSVSLQNGDPHGATDTASVSHQNVGPHGATEYVASALHQNGDLHGATDDNSLQSADAISDDP